MIKKNILLLLTAGLVLFCGFLFLLGIVLPGIGRMSAISHTPTLDLFATLAAVTPGQTGYSATSVLPTIEVQDGSNSLLAAEPTGKIAFTCQIYRYQSSEQICIMNADGSGWKRLTLEDGFRHYYPSPAPDGRSVVYSAFREANVYEVYETTLDGTATRITDRLGVLTAPEISPDGTLIAFMRWTAASTARRAIPEPWPRP